MAHIVPAQRASHLKHARGASVQISSPASDMAEERSSWAEGRKLAQGLEKVKKGLLRDSSSTLLQRTRVGMEHKKIWLLGGPQV